MGDQHHAPLSSIAQTYALMGKEINEDNWTINWNMGEWLGSFK